MAITTEDFSDTLLKQPLISKYMESFPENVRSQVLVSTLLMGITYIQHSLNTEHISIAEVESLLKEV